VHSGNRSTIDKNKGPPVDGPSLKQRFHIIVAKRRHASPSASNQAFVLEFALLGTGSTFGEPCGPACRSPRASRIETSTYTGGNDGGLIPADIRIVDPRQQQGSIGL
jgi:hypothetical protein